MKRIATTLLSLAFAVAAIAGGNNKKESVMVISPDQSTIVWHGEKVTGKHHGHVKVRQGNIVLNPNGKIKSAYVQVDMTSITNEDIEDADTRAKLVNHLKSEDFFGVEKYPYAEISIKKFKPTGKPGEYTADGELTIKGKTHPVSFPFTMNRNGSELTASGELVFDRSKYDVRYGSDSFFDNLGDKVIYDDVKLEFTVKAMAKK